MKPMLMVVTRLVTRPYYTQFVRTLSDHHWIDNPNVDLAVAYHGDRHFAGATQMRVAHAHEAGIVAREFDRCDSTNERLPPFLWEVLRWGVGLGYRIVGVMDDDARYPEPAEAVDAYISTFDADPKAGCLGPIGGWRKMWRYNGDCNFIEPFYRNPWAPLGSQIYRAEALESLDLEFLKELNFRADAIISMLLYLYGWDNYEMDIKFDHALSSGLDQGAHDEAFHERRIEQVGHDYRIYDRIITIDYCYLKHEDKTDRFGRDKIHYLMSCIKRLERSERGHHEKRLRLMRNPNARRDPKTLIIRG